MRSNNMIFANSCLRPLCKKDVALMLEWMHDTDINSNFKFDFESMTKEKAIEFIKNSINDEAKHFAVVNEQDEYLGTISLKHISVSDKNAEYAISMRKSAQRTGAAQKATMDILKYAFDELELHKVYLNVLEENKRANLFYKKCGFVYEGQFKEHICLKGKFKNLNWYGITKEQFSMVVFRKGQNL